MNEINQDSTLVAMEIMVVISDGDWSTHCFNSLFDVVLPAGQVMVWIRVIHLGHTHTHT